MNPAAVGRYQNPAGVLHRSRDLGPPICHACSRGFTDWPDGGDWTIKRVLIRGINRSRVFHLSWSCSPREMARPWVRCAALTALAACVMLARVMRAPARR